MHPINWTIKNVSFFMPGYTIDEFRLNRTLCDAVIKVGDVEFPVHKLIMCVCMPYFSALTLEWSEPDRSVFVFEDVTPEIMELIIDFAYTSNVSLTNDNVLDLMFAADRYNISSLVDVCSEFLYNQLRPENCIGVWQMTDIVFSPVLQQKAFFFICDYFEEVVNLEQFLQLKVHELADILEHDGLQVEQETTAFECILKWIAHMPDERRDDIATLLSKVRLGLLSLTYLQRIVLTNDVVTANDDSKLMVLNAIKVMSEDPAPGTHHKITLPRLPKAVLLATGGWANSTPSDDILSYDYSTDCWFKGPLNKLMHPLAYHGSAFLNECLYVVGGVQNTDWLNSVHRFDFLTQIWIEVAPMHQQRCYVSVTVLNECVYAMGGYDGYNRLKTAEVYQPESNQWTFIASMNSVRSDANCTTLRNKIYICGGFTGKQNLRTAECYDASTNQWTLIAPMSSRRSGLGVVTYMDEVFVVGGSSVNNRLSSAECYNPLTNTWRNVCNMFTPRSNFGIAVVDKRVFVVGGWSETLNTCVEYYDSITNSWSHVCELTTPRSALNCTSLSGLPFLDQYSDFCSFLPIVEMIEEPTFGDKDCVREDEAAVGRRTRCFGAPSLTHFCHSTTDPAGTPCD